MIHRVDIHASVWEAVLTHPDVEYHTSTNVVDIRETEDDVTVFDDRGNSWTGDILIGCDGVKSVVRQSLLGDAPRRHRTCGLPCGYRLCRYAGRFAH